MNKGETLVQCPVCKTGCLIYIKDYIWKCSKCKHEFNTGWNSKNNRQVDGH